MKTKLVYINKIMDSPPTNSGLKKKDVYLTNNLDNLLPVYSASQDEDLIFGWVKKDGKWKSYKNVLTWNKDGSSGRVFYRETGFVPYEKVKILKIKSEFEEYLDYKFLKFVIESRLLSLGFGFNFKCSMERVLNLQIEIPVDKNGNFSVLEQKKLVKIYEKMATLHAGIKHLYNEIMELKIKLIENYPTEKLSISRLFNPEKGFAKYTHNYIRNHKGEYPVYSSQTENEGVIGRIDTYDYDTECLTWTTDGIHAGTVFYRKGKFSMTTHCGALILKEEFKEKIDLKYILFQLETCLKEYATGEGNKRVTVELIKDVPIRIPINNKKDYDLIKQREITAKNIKIDTARRGLRKDFEQIVKSKIDIFSKEHKFS